MGFGAAHDALQGGAGKGLGQAESGKGGHEQGKSRGDYFKGDGGDASPGAALGSKEMVDLAGNKAERGIAKEAEQDKRDGEGNEGEEPIAGAADHKTKARK